MNLISITISAFKRIKELISLSKQKALIAVILRADKCGLIIYVDAFNRPLIAIKLCTFHSCFYSFDLRLIGKSNSWLIMEECLATKRYLAVYILGQWFFLINIF